MLQEQPLPHEALHERLQDLVQNEYKRSLGPQIQREIEHIVDQTEETRRAEELLNFAKSKTGEKLLKTVSEDVPQSILPADCSAVLQDIRIGRHGPDDRVYNKHPDIRTKIPRGATVLQWRSAKASWSSVVIYGLKKFTGGVGDEDEEQPENNDKWSEYFLASPSTAVSVVCLEKVNGEAAHFSGRYIDGQFYLIAGSKNVHMLIRDANDIDLYIGSRYEYAKVIARTVCETLTAMAPLKRSLVLSLLHHTQCTLLGEILQPQSQHIVSLSHLAKPEVVMFSMTFTYTGHDVDSFSALPPHHLLDLCKVLGLTVASYTVVPVAQIMDQKALVRRQTGCEGEVFYYLDHNDNTIGLVKVKTVWYVLLRALREKAVYCSNPPKKQSPRAISDIIASTHKRFNEIQKWLKFSDKYLHRWKDTSKSFLLWLKEEIKKGTVEPNKIRPGFPTIWKKFTRTTEQPEPMELEFKCQPACDSNNEQSGDVLRTL
ncbi:hypothetical protein GWK47_033030 [Chionoecetes opilio]|uniref:DUF7920 domain-containing protein n=1 Tax=Chionoecetes opilio TaxID=41210 RepID=A0A8J4YHI2_CHIOP|nr:hypothetical protein GWK47_033030 [Chionoecetes opilio]